jgi:hypothetical protein
VYPDKGVGLLPKSPFLPFFSLASFTIAASIFPKGAFTSLPGTVPTEYGVGSLAVSGFAFFQLFVRPLPSYE